MTRGKHKGARVLLTLDKDSYERWKTYAAALNMPTATLLREILEMSEPVAGEMVAQLEKIQKDDSAIEDVLGPLLVRVLRNMDKAQ